MKLSPHLCQEAHSGGQPVCDSKTRVPRGGSLRACWGPTYVLSLDPPPPPQAAGNAHFVRSWVPKDRHPVGAVEGCGPQVRELGLRGAGSSATPSFPSQPEGKIGLPRANPRLGSLLHAVPVPLPVVHSPPLHPWDGDPWGPRSGRNGRSQPQLQPPRAQLGTPPHPPHSIRVFSNESVLYIRWPKYWSFSFSISPSNAIQG